MGYIRIVAEKGKNNRSSSWALLRAGFRLRCAWLPVKDIATDIFKPGCPTGFFSPGVYKVIPVMHKKLTLLWQSTSTPSRDPLRDWILEIFSPLVDGEVFDGEHKLVLDNCLVVDTFLNWADPAYYPRFRGRNAFLLREPDEYFRDVSGVYINFCGVFRMHYSGAFRQERVLPVPLGYANGLGRKSEPKPASRRKYAWAMLGMINKSTRPDAVRALLPVQPGYWYASDGWTPGAAPAATKVRQNQSASSYQKLLAESAFSPAPMGNVQQETNRPFEALEAGSIPLLERRWLMDAHRSVLGDHPLPTFSSWKKAAGFAQSMWNDKQALDQLQAECLHWWQSYKANLSAEAQAFVDRLWMDIPRSNSQFVRNYARLPGWFVFELLRHHSAGALRRRMARQARKLLEGGRLFRKI